VESVITNVVGVVLIFLIVLSAFGLVRLYVPIAALVLWFSLGGILQGQFTMWEIILGLFLLLLVLSPAYYLARTAKNYLDKKSKNANKEESQAAEKQKQ
jgi:Ca2+/Na+ antiporter